jgi:hypothetical protein
MSETAAQQESVPVAASTAAASETALSVNGMDEPNRVAMNILFTQGKDPFLEHVFTARNPDGTAKTNGDGTTKYISYAEMRQRYG